MPWLEDHLQDFVAPVYGEVPTEPLGYFTPAELTIIKNAWRSVKRNTPPGKEILLAGRDVFIFEILARRENYPTTFMPECSRQSVDVIRKKTPNIENFFLFDTGFVGSIPKNLGIESFSLLSYVYRNNVATKQIFPRLSFSRGLALKIEKTPKYWESARPDFGTFDVIQNFSKKEEFIDAARLTIEIYKNSAPKFIKQHQPIGKGA